MLYRLDYTLAVMVFGFLIGLFLSKRLSTLPASRLARGYYIGVAVLLAIRTAAFVPYVLMNLAPFRVLTGVFGDLLGLTFGVVFGLALFRTDSRQFLTDSYVVRSFCLVLAFTFAIAAIGKAFTTDAMAGFFTQSGYSVTFLKIIVIAEFLGALGMLIPWAVLPALMGLSIDMFGAVLTHIHNGDPLNDSTGAIALLIRLLALGILLSLQRRSSPSSSLLRRPLFQVTSVALLCFAIAWGGSVAVRHVSSPAQGVRVPAK